MEIKREDMKLNEETNSLFRDFNGSRGDVRLLNTFLTVMLVKKKEVKELLLHRFENQSEDIAWPFATWSLLCWEVNKVPHSIELVKVGTKIRFGMTHRNVLSPLDEAIIKEKFIKQLIMNFFIDPIGYLQKKQ